MAPERKPATGPQRKRNAAETRNRLLQAARRLFAKANYGNVGIREIGAAAGVNPALISRYFGSKRNLFLEVASILNSEGIEALPDVPPMEKTSMAMGSILSGGAQSAWATDFRITALSALDPNVSDVMAKTYDNIRQQIMEVLPGEQAATRAELILAQIMGASMVVNLLRGADSPRIDIEYMNKFGSSTLAVEFTPPRVG
ncbi:TetR/AcrR family transcriptional regulator [Desulfovibrio desulfuricans]|uniref:TetR/AcrR family transcriptional regulator n=1 Tax=Desulfovibrio desulfuricans TaxID=876 RepID=UPI001D082F80|nr:TetR/AcrR family transcriptional regulator [Desulfovibrio desulfuricans]MCB6543628.1 TetR/AcrR family transcriptional regulator [Desulfovibrio desulfuricans]MCB6554706.1 TetR/AcrR family transcriptional regulator [Desulfovibrio desulfuricans]MCB6566557.1 TetR/AcrR family transcriptional regulator [Desulfovibrio desulfuricans]MCB7347732.1 TetR/AcrR family transcriptional regulator [Desulfovibrio desulfuricans]MCQ5219652.1 TetR/AcrR family transcriptional regulator [Desulfovibrio desulfurican